jgi:hypothetical protein
MTNTAVADALDRLASQIEAAPVHLVGASINVSGGPGGGSVTGLRIDAVAGPRGTHTTGMRIEVDPRVYAADANALVADLREAASAARTSLPARSWISGLIDRTGKLGNKALESAVGTAAAEIAKAYL